jgi:hypothetical protein
MLVELKTPWFSPSPNVIKESIQHISGRRFKPGVHEMDDSLKDVLPKSAKILKGAPKKEVAVKSDTLRDHDLARTSADKLEEIAKEADVQAEANRVARQKKM